MTFEDFLIAKLIVLGVGALIWGLYCGFTGRPLWREPPEKDQ